jgi:DNA-binding NarL/FixJ family response regulator
MEFPDPWGEYARLQAISAHTFTVDSNSWGLEEEMNSLLDDPTSLSPAKATRLKRFGKTAARRERFRSRLREVHKNDLAPVPVNTVAQLEARQTLQQIETKVSPKQWAVLSAVGQGYSHGEIALERSVSAGAIRLQVVRLRQQLTEFRSAI